MWTHEEAEDRRPNSEVMTKLAKGLRKFNASRYSLKETPPRHYLTTGTTIGQRNLVLGYSNSSCSGDTFLFTGQCLIKNEEDMECPITLEDAMECGRLQEILASNPTPGVCMYPDSTYNNFLAGWSGEATDEGIVETCTTKYIEFRKKMLPGITHLRTSEYEHEIDRLINELKPDIDKVRGSIRRIYGGRILQKDQTHKLQQSILEYGIKNCLIPEILGRNEGHITTFAEPDEICSVSAAEIFAAETRSGRKFELLGQIALPPIGYTMNLVRMYSAPREQRIHLNERRPAIRSKFDENPYFLLLYLYMSPLTTEDQIAYVGKSRDRKVGLDIAMEQVEKFRGYVT